MTTYNYSLHLDFLLGFVLGGMETNGNKWPTVGEHAVGLPIKFPMGNPTDILMTASHSFLFCFNSCPILLVNIHVFPHIPTVLFTLLLLLFPIRSHFVSILPKFTCEHPSMSSHILPQHSLCSSCCFPFADIYIYTWMPLG